MTQENKELLLRDLSARLPYNVVIHTDFGDYKMIGLVGDRVLTECEEEGRHNDFPIDVCKPYLRPMSSMTEEERKELVHLVVYVEGHRVIKQIKDGGLDIMEGKYQFHSLQVLDWLNKKGFDYCGLIPKNLALSAHVGMYKF